MIDSELTQEHERWDAEDPVVATVEDVQKLLDAIPKMKGIYGIRSEEAHMAEDELWRAVLRAIATGAAVDGASMARLALTTAGLDFSRWYS